MWGKVKTGSKAGFDKIYAVVDKLEKPVNRLSNKLGAEAFWPTTLDKESDKAARILRSFCKDGFYEEELQNRPDGISEKQKVLKKIPAEVIRNAKGLAIFTTMRTGLWASGSGGSGILVGRLPDGSWSPPSGLMLHTVGLGFLVGIDIYDCVMVINTEEALKAFSKVRCTVGGEISAVAGPVGVGGVLDSEVHRRQAPIFTYLKSRGFYAGVQIDGTILIERNDANADFYGEKLSVSDIMAGKVRHVPYEVRPLMQTIKAASGEQVDEKELPDAAPPSDFVLEKPKGQLPGDTEIGGAQLFGVPDKEDPDPYGVLALEKEGLAVREAGTKVVPARESFIFNPSPSSPVYNAFNRNSLDGRTLSSSRRNSQRLSVVSTATQTIDMATQTDFDTPATSPYSMTSSGRNKMNEIPEDIVTIDEKPKASPPPLPARELPKIDIVDQDTEKTSDETPDAEKPHDIQAEKHVPMNMHQQLASAESDSEDDDEEEPVIIETVQQAMAPIKPNFLTKGKIVTVEKKPAPALPPRNPIRDRKRPLIITSDNDNDATPPPVEFEDKGISPMSSHRNSVVSTSNEGINTDTSKATSISSSELGKEKEEVVEEKAVLKRLDSEENDFHSAAATPAVTTSNPMDEIKHAPEAQVAVATAEAAHV